MSEGMLVPDGWTIQNLGKSGTFTKGKGISKKETTPHGLPCIRYAEIYTYHDIVIKKFRSFIDPTCVNNTKKINKNDIIFAGSGETIEDIGKSVAFVGDDEAYVGGDSIIMSPSDSNDSIFLSYQLNDDIRRTQLRKLGQGSSIVHLYPSDLKELTVHIPPLPEQKKIASILTSVDDVIEKTEAHISKLQDLKKGMMTELLTKGIGHSEFKDSPVGRIPKSWTVERLGKLFTFKNGINASGEKFGQGIKFINLKEILSNDSLYPNDIPGSVTLNEKEIEQNSVNYGDILFNRTSETQDELGLTSTYLGQEKVVFGGFVIRARPINNTFITEYLKYAFTSPYIRKEIVTKGQGAIRANIGQTELSQIYIPCPSHQEQEKISSMLTSIDDNIKSKRGRLSQTKALKKALMNDLLTGKKRVTVG